MKTDEKLKKPKKRKFSILQAVKPTNYIIKTSKDENKNENFKENN